MKEIDNFLKKELVKIDFYQANGFQDSEIISLILTESYFRDSIQRICEIALWVYRYFINSEVLERTSVGIAQIQLRHWKSMGFIKSIEPTLTNIVTIFNWEINYLACQKYIKQYCDITKKPLCVEYRGANGKYYTQVYLYICDYLKARNFA